MRDRVPGAGATSAGSLDSAGSPITQTIAKPRVDLGTAAFDAVVPPVGMLDFNREPFGLIFLGLLGGLCAHLGYGRLQPLQHLRACGLQQLFARWIEAKVHQMAELTWNLLFLGR